ncbi:MAG: exonuclease SbcCD subunit D [Sulfolobales archaeon]
MRLLHVADTHIGYNKPGKLRERELDFYEVFDEVIEIAIRERVDAVMHCGDLFNEPDPDPQTYFYAFKSLKKLRNADIEFLVIAGQHDQPKTSSLSPLRVLEEAGLVKVLAIREPATVVVNLRSGDLGVTAVPYADPLSMQEYIKYIKKPDTKKKVLMAHLLLKELNIPGAHLSIPELRCDGYDYVALGDYHIRYVSEYGGVPVVYPGSTEAVDYLESSDERFVALIDLSKEDVEVSWIKLSKFRKWLVVKSSTYGELIRFLSKVDFSSFSKPPILYAKVSNADLLDMSARSVIDYLRNLREGGKILTYKLETPSIFEEYEETEHEEITPAPTLESVVRNLLKDPKISEYVLTVIKGCEDEGFIDALITSLLNDQELISKLEKLVRSK